MRILYHHRTLSKDGQNVHIDELIAAFRRAGHVVHVVGPEGHADAAFGSDGGLLSRIRAKLPGGVSEVLEFAYSVLAFIKLWRAARRFKPDFLYERYNLFLLAGVWLKHLTGLPFVLEVNAPLALERAKTPGLALPSFARWSEGAAWRAADIILPVTAVLGAHLAAAGVVPARMCVMPNGINLSEFPETLDGAKTRERYGLGERIVIGFTGFLRDWHGLPAVLAAMQALRESHDVHFLVVGDGPAREGLARDAAGGGLSERVTVTGVVARSEIAAHIAAFDIAVQPSATAYASPLKLFEYMAAGRAIVAPDQPSLREILTDGGNGLLFAPQDKAAFQAALHRLVTDPVLRGALGAAARTTVVDRDLTWDGNARKVVDAVAGRAAGDGIRTEGRA